MVQTSKNYSAQEEEKYCRNGHENQNEFKKEFIYLRRKLNKRMNRKKNRTDQSKQKLIDNELECISMIIS